MRVLWYFPRMSPKNYVMPAVLLSLICSTLSTANAAPSYTLNLSFEVTQKYPGVDAPENVINGCREGFPIDKSFTQSARWEVLGSKQKVIATASVGKVSVKNVKKVVGPFQNEDDEDFQPYIFNGTCTYTSKIRVPRSNVYKFKFANIDLQTTYSFAELAKKKWKLSILTDLNCDGLYGKPCTYTSK